MTPTLGLASVALLALCIVAEIGYQLSFKLVADGPAPPGIRRGIVLRALLWLGVALWVVQVVSWIAVLKRTPLTVAYPVMALTYAGVPLASMVVLKKKMGASQIAGAALVLVGVLAVSMSHG